MSAQPLHNPPGWEGLMDPAERGILGQWNIAVSTGLWPGCHGDTCAFGVWVLQGIKVLFHPISWRILMFL